MDTSPSLEFQEAFVAEHAESAQHGVGIHAEYCCEIARWGELLPWLRLALRDCASDVSSDLVMEKRGVRSVNTFPKHVLVTLAQIAVIPPWLGPQPGRPPPFDTGLSDTSAPFTAASSWIAEGATTAPSPARCPKTPFSLTSEGMRGLLQASERSNMRIPVDTTSSRFVSARPAEQVMAYDTKAPEVDANGQPVFNVTLFVVGTTNEMIKVKVAGEPKGLGEFTPVRVSELVATTWQMGDRTGVSFRAAAIEAITTRSAAS